MKKIFLSIFIVILTGISVYIYTLLGPFETKEIKNARINGEIIRRNIMNTQEEFSFDDIDNNLNWDIIYAVDGFELDRFKTSKGEFISSYPYYSTHVGDEYLLMYDKDILKAIILLNDFPYEAIATVQIENICISKFIYSFDKTARFKVLDVDTSYDFEIVAENDIGIISITDETTDMFYNYQEKTTVPARSIVYSYFDMIEDDVEGDVHIFNNMNEFTQKYKDIDKGILRNQINEFENNSSEYKNIGIIVSRFSYEEETQYVTHLYNNNMIFFDRNIYDINDMLTAEIINDKLYVTK